MADLTVVEARTPAELEQAFAIRRRVFVLEQGVPERLEIDGREHEARHLLALLAGRPVGTLRMRLIEDGRVAKIERVAVLAEARGARIGQALIGAILRYAEAEGAVRARLHAQTRAQAFYARLGFVAEGPEFEEDGIPHVAMSLTLRPERATAVAAGA